MKSDNLRRELLAAGASKQEARELAGIAVLVSKLRGMEPQVQRRPRIPWWRTGTGFWSLICTAFTGLAAGMALVALAQTALPGNPLYPVKRASEQAALVFQPGYKATIMMRRAQEVKLLVAGKQNSRLVTVALADYTSDMRGMSASNYAVLDYCHTSLVQAEAMASPAEKSQISIVLSQLPTDHD